MRAGKLDRRVDVVKWTSAQDEYGDPVFEGWEIVSANRAAGYRPLSGDERFTAEQFVAKQQVEWKIRRSADVAGINPLGFAIIYPAYTGSPYAPPTHTVYDVVDVPEVGRREGFLVRTVRRAENPNAS